MNVLVVGSGGREHAIAWKIARSDRLDRLFAAPGNAGIARVATCVEIDAGDQDGLAEFARKEGIDLTVVGPEAPLCDGIVERFRRDDLRIVGPTRSAAELEGDKAFAKSLMQRYHIPTAKSKTVESLRDAELHLRRTSSFPVVIKAAGLAAGKGVLVCDTQEAAQRAARSMLEQDRFGEAGHKVVIEEFLAGEEASILALTDGRAIAVMESSQDHKRVFDGDRGPNTGGMGAYSPAPAVTPGLMRTIESDVLVPVVHAMHREGRPYQGILYAGIMITPSGPKVLEFNVRFGDPECQALLMRLRSDLLYVLDAVERGELEKVDLEWDPRPAVCVVIASGGYPSSYETGKPISGLEEAEGDPEVVVFHAGTRTDGDNVVTDGGRVLGVTALGETVAEARDRAYAAAGKISFELAHYRRDIAHRALGRSGQPSPGGPAG